MSTDRIIDIAHEVIWTVVEVSSPLLLISLIIGLVVSILQTITSIQEQTLTFVPKFVAIMLVLILCGSWIMNKVSGLFVNIMEQVPALIK
ncbi:MAG: flagellar biosynthesis protein FliQ [Butyribacter sp.]|nr:flagellar biosynthesis protein FliQ [bacterium]MDY3855251.1 flagellar biosynthesis protein FliQ [Butyribacter sp.]